MFQAKSLAASRRLLHQNAALMRRLYQPMIQLSAAGKRFGHKLLFEGADWLITPRDRVGLVGANGTGKSTLMKILAGMETLDYGSISTAKGISAGYLPQDGLTLSGRTVFAECMSVFRELRAMEQEMEDLTRTHVGTRPCLPRIRAGRRTLSAHRARISDARWICHRSASRHRALGLRFSQRRLASPDRRIFRRLADADCAGEIACCKQPNLLLLDEPTNHLDLEARNWLEQYLTHYPIAFVLISHDRYFLDVTVNKIVEIWNKKIHLYTGNYDKYLSQKTQRLEQLEAAYRNQNERIEQLGSFHQSLSLPGDQSQTGAKPDQRTGEDRAHRTSRKKKRPSTFRFRSPNPADGSSRNSSMSRNPTARKKSFAMSTS